MARLIPTRGPWIAGCTAPDKTLKILGAPKRNGGRRVIAIVCGDDIRSEADAALLAAAPKLLQALRTAKKFIADELETREASMLLDPSESESEYISDAVNALAIVTTAIRQAEVRDDD